MSIETMDLTGQTFGRLTPFERGLDRVTKSGRTYKTWNCKCECGNVKNVTAYDLVRQKTKSCGCLRRDTCARENHSHRVIDVDGIKHTIQEWSQINGIGITTIYERLSNGWNEKDAVTTVPHSGVKHDYALHIL